MTRLDFPVEASKIEEDGSPRFCCAARPTETRRLKQVIITLSKEVARIVRFRASKVEAIISKAGLIRVQLKHVPCSMPRSSIVTSSTRRPSHMAENDFWSRLACLSL